MLNDVLNMSTMNPPCLKEKIEKSLCIIEGQSDSFCWWKSSFQEKEKSHKWKKKRDLNQNGLAEWNNTEV